MYCVIFFVYQFFCLILIYYFSRLFFCIIFVMLSFNCFSLFLYLLLIFVIEVSFFDSEVKAFDIDNPLLLLLVI